MGYSIYVKVKTKQEESRLYNLLSKHIRKGDYRLAKGNHQKYGLSYGLGKYRVGFDYSCLNDTERNYLYGIIKWLAGKAGTKKYYYDCQAIDILTGKEV